MGIWRLAAPKSRCSAPTPAPSRSTSSAAPAIVGRSAQAPCPLSRRSQLLPTPP